MARTWPKTAAVTIAALAILAFLSLMGWALANREPVTAQSGFTRVSKPAPDFALPLFDGGQLALSQNRGKPAVINFWASWCPPCRDEAPLLEQAWRAYQGDGVLFVGVDIQDSEAEAVSYLREFDITYPNGPDRDGRITVDYGVIGLPVTFFVNREGMVERRWVGAIPKDRLESWLAELAAGAPPSGDAEGETRERFFELER